ncbi:7396_t:CDS:2 [Cetraspora pellucida]|uniref:7396_t:CDS:1 n=1 Tax=Cetraspora pellucida TaxID=1433469 RepID=A0ACA9KK33_9GLOM|nr:7396_t:CDS:2 [Cetraspora pellucida]
MQIFKHLYDQLLQVDSKSYRVQKFLTEEEQKFEQEFFDKLENDLKTRQELQIQIY